MIWVCFLGNFERLVENLKASKGKRKMREKRDDWFVRKFKIGREFSRIVFFLHKRKCTKQDTESSLILKKDLLKIRKKLIFIIFPIFNFFEEKNIWEISWSNEKNSFA